MPGGWWKAPSERSPGGGEDVIYGIGHDRGHSSWELVAMGSENAGHGLWVLWFWLPWGEELGHSVGSALCPSNMADPRSSLLGVLSLFRESQPRIFMDYVDFLISACMRHCLISY